MKIVMLSILLCIFLIGCGNITGNVAYLDKPIASAKFEDCNKAIDKVSLEMKSGLTICVLTRDGNIAMIGGTFTGNQVGELQWKKI